MENSNERKLLLKKIQKEFLNPELFKAIMLPDNLKFLKQIEVFKNAPCNINNRNLVEEYYKLVPECPCRNGYLPFFYKSMKWFFNEMEDKTVSSYIVDSLIEVTNDKLGERMYRSPINKSENYYKELNRLRLINSNIYPDDYIEVTDDIKYSRQEYLDDETLKNLYKKRKIGFIGEEDFFNEITLDKKIFVSRDYTNGSGYDIYCLDKKEMLAEVKSTLNLGDNDYFSLTANELKVMNSLDNNFAEYYIIRKYIDLSKDNHYYYKIFNIHKNDLLITSINNEDGNVIEYERDSIDSLRFDRKEKVLTLKKW